MAFGFKVYERAESTLEDLGTVASMAGRGGKLAFIPGNLVSGKRVTIVVLNSKGESNIAVCSVAISASVRSALKEGITRPAILGVISKLHIFENEEGAHYIAQEGSGSLDFHPITEVMKETLSYEELVTL